MLWGSGSIAFGVQEHSWFQLRDWLQLRDTSRPYIWGELYMVSVVVFVILDVLRKKEKPQSLTMEWPGLLVYGGMLYEGSIRSSDYFVQRGSPMP